MNNKMRIKDKKEFQLILNKGKKKYTPFFLIYYKDKSKENSRFGFTQVKKFGKAYKRNYYKRILREIVRNNQNKFKKDYDYIIIVLKKCDTLTYQEIEYKILQTIKEIK